MLFRSHPEHCKEGPLKQALETIDRLIEQDLQPAKEGWVEISKGVAKERQISIEDDEMRHGRKSKSKRFDGYKRQIARDLDGRVILAATVTPGNRSDSEALGELLERATEERELLSLHVDRQYLHAAEVLPLKESGVEVFCRAPASSNRDGLFTKREFEIDLETKVAQCPNGEEVSFELGQTIEFPAEKCDICPLREQCTKRKLGGGRTIKIHPNEEFFKELRLFETSPEGRAKLRPRVDVEHCLAHVGQRQGDKARYIGARKNTFELRIVCAIQNLERTQALATEKEQRPAEEDRLQQAA